MSVNGKKVVVALTGRLDSTVAAFLLKKQGYEVIGLAMVVSSPDLTAEPENLPHCYLSDLGGLRDLCERIKIPFYATDIKSQFDYSVLDKLVENKLSAFANSACFDCSRLRMGTLFDKMKSLKADFIATGHYCKVYQNLNSNEYFIHSNNTTDVDQSLMLANLSQEILKHLILPLGELRKEEVVKIANSFHLEIKKSDTKENFCFKDLSSSEKIIKNKVPKSLIKEGVFVNKENETIYGDHDGIVYHHLGEKDLVTTNGIKIDKSFEIIEYEPNKKYIYLGQEKDLTFVGAQIVEISVSDSLDKRKPLECFIKFKYSKDYIESHIFFKNNNSGFIQFNQGVYPLLKREHIVVYDSDKRNSKVIGTAVVMSRGAFKPFDRVRTFRSKEEINPESTDNELSSEAKDNQFYFKF